MHEFRRGAFDVEYAFGRLKKSGATSCRAKMCATKLSKDLSHLELSFYIGLSAFTLWSKSIEHIGPCSLLISPPANRLFIHVGFRGHRFSLHVEFSFQVKRPEILFYIYNMLEYSELSAVCNDPLAGWNQTSRRSLKYAMTLIATHFDLLNKIICRR